jgi:hypothetical protein
MRIGSAVQNKAGNCRHSEYDAKCSGAPPITHFAPTKSNGRHGSGFVQIQLE